MITQAPRSPSQWAHPVHRAAERSIEILNVRSITSMGQVHRAGSIFGPGRASGRRRSILTGCCSDITVTRVAFVLIHRR